MIRPGLIIVVIGAVALLFAWLAVDAVTELQQLPEQPVAVRVADVVGPMPWVKVVDATPVCEAVVRERDRDVVPIVGPAGAVAIVVELGHKDLCATLVPPLEGRITTSIGGSAVVERLRAVTGGVFFMPTARLELRDVRGSARGQLGAMLALFAVFFTVDALLVVRLVRSQRKVRRAAGLAGIASSAAVPIDGVVGGVPLAVSATDDVLPAGPLRLSATAERRGTLARAVGTPLLAAAALTCSGVDVWIAADILHDRTVWATGETVAAEVKGQTTRYQGVYVDTELAVAWMAPGTEQLLHADKSFGTLFVGPDDDVGEVRALRDEPSAMTVRAAVDAIPWRLPVLVVWGLLAAVCALGAKQAWAGSRRLAAIAADPEQVTVTLMSINEVRVNGVRTGYTVSGIALDGGTFSAHVPSAGDPSARLVHLDGSGARVLGVRARGQAKVNVLVTTDLEPFELSRQERARAQAVLAARCSSTVLVG